MINGIPAVKAIRYGFVILCLAPLFFLSHSVSVAGSTTDDAAKVVRTLAEEIWSSRQDAEGRKEQLAAAIKAKTSVDLLSRLVLGKHWRSLESADQDEYRSLFSQVVIGGLASRLDLLLRDFNGPLDQHFSIAGSGAVGKKDVLIRSKVVATDGRALAVDWRLRGTESEPVIIDLIVEGVSLLVSQRSEFAAVIERSRMDGLMDLLRKRAQSGDF